MLVILLIFGSLCTFAYSNNHNLDPNKTVFISTTEISETTGSATETTELLSTTFVTCDDNNCTELNVTTLRKIINRTESVQNPDQNKDPSNNIWCTCNLQAHYCDINCCCDPDCSAANKRIFKYCEIEENRFVDDRYCNYIKHIYVNNTPFEWKVNQEGLFCLISRNLPDSHLVQNEMPVKSIDTLKAARSFWTDLSEKHLDVEFSALGSRNYASGDPVIIVKNDSTIDILRIPKNLITRPCVFNEDIVYLKNVGSTCSQIVTEANYADLSISTVFQGFKVIGNPRTVNLTEKKGKFYHNCPRNICIEIHPKLCDDSLSNCIEVKNDANIKFHCSWEIRHNLNHCQNAARSIHYKLYHNGTNGLEKVEVLAVLSNFSYHFGKDTFHFDQHFSAEFLWTNQTKNYSEIFSGNPGYIIGKPILTATKISSGNKTFIHRNSVDNFLAFPGNVEQNCFGNMPVDFGYNFLTKCQLRKPILFKVNENSTGMCRKIQETVFNLWGIPREGNRSLVFGLFGNAKPHAQEDWANVLYIAEPDSVLNQTRGNLTNGNTTLICHNIVTLLDVKVVYSRVDFEDVGVLNQHKILGISFGFGKAGSYTSISRRNESIMSLKLISQVSFIDITRRKERNFVEPPSLDIHLPYDFFYPFIRVGNGTSSLSVPNWALFIIIVLLSSISMCEYDELSFNIC